jgi:hypothetical protein
VGRIIFADDQTSRMKFYSIVCAALLMACSAVAQDEPSTPRPPSVPAKPKFTEKFSSTLNLYTSQWLDAPPGITVKPVSLGASVAINYKVPLYSPYVVLMLGPGVSFTDFRTNGYPVANESRDSTYFVQLQPAQYKRNKLSLVNVEVPVELRFATGKNKSDKSWFFAPGFVAGILVNDYVKTVGEDAKGNRLKQKVYYTPNLSKFNYGVSARLGYGFIGLYGYYGLSPLFEEGKGPGMTFYKVGITFGG